jgi:hypothetical protein
MAGKSTVTILKLEYDPSGEARLIMLPRKTSLLHSLPTVPQTDTGRWDEYSKVFERTAAKELGKMTP